jgi:hypothetical protein
MEDASTTYYSQRDIFESDEDKNDDDEDYVPTELEGAVSSTDEDAASEEHSDSDTASTEANYVPVPPTQEQLAEQLSDVSFENNRMGRFQAILVDGQKYR